MPEPPPRARAGARRPDAGKRAARSLAGKNYVPDFFRLLARKKYCVSDWPVADFPKKVLCPRFNAKKILCPRFSRKKDCVPEFMCFYCYVSGFRATTPTHRPGRRSGGSGIQGPRAWIEGPAWTPARRCRVGRGGAAGEAENRERSASPLAERACPRGPGVVSRVEGLHPTVGQGAARSSPPKRWKKPGSAGGKGPLRVSTVAASQRSAAGARRR